MMAFGAKIKLSVNTSNASAFRTEIQKYVNSATSDNPIKLKNFSVSMTKQQRASLIKDLQTYLANDSSLVLKIGKIDATGAVNKLRQQLQTMLGGLSITGVKDFLGESNINKVVQDINAAEQSAKRLAAQMEVVNGIQSNLKYIDISKLTNNQSYSDNTEIKSAIADYNALKTKIDEVKSATTELSAEEVDALQQEDKALQQTIDELEKKHSITIRTSKEAAEAAEQEGLSSKKQLELAKQQASLKKQVQQYIMSNSKAYKHFGDELDGMMIRLGSSGALTEEELKEIRKQLYEVQMSAKAAGYSGNTFFDTMKKGFAKFGGWSLVTRGLMSVFRALKEVLSAVKEVDAAMTELRKVTDLSEQSYANYLKTAQNTSQRIGATLADTINSTADFARLGYSLADSSALSEAALIYKNVGDGIEDIGTASESLISTIKAFEQFGESADNAMSIVDRFNEVGNKFAISSEGIGSALQRSASSLAAAGNTLNESIALVTGMNAVVQDPEKVGTALKTIAMFLRAAKTEAEEAGESTEGMANSVSELREELLTLTKNKVDIMIDETTFKSTYQIMKELSQVWGELSDVDTANILELIGGKRNANAVTSLLTNFKDAESALQTAADASGSALEENEKYIDSIAGKLSVFQAKFESLSTTILNSGIVKFVVEVGSKLLGALNILSKVPGFIAAVAFSIAMVTNQVKASKNSDILQQIMLSKVALVEEKKATQELSIAYSGLTNQQKRLLEIQLERMVANGALTESEKAQILSTLSLSAAEKGLGATNKALSLSFKELAASIPIWGWISLAITGVIELVMHLTSVFSKNKQAAIDSANGIIDAYKNAKETYNSNSKSLVGMREEFDKLSKGVDENGNNISLTAKQYETFLSLIDQIVDLSPDICSGYDNEGKAILNYKTALDDAIKSQETYIQNQRNIYLGKGKEIFDGKTEEYKDAKDDLHNAAGANDLKDKSLDDALNPGFVDTFLGLFGNDKAQKKIDAYKDAFEQLGITIRAGTGSTGTWGSSTEDIMKMYENADKIMVLLRNSGAYTEEELTKIETRLHGLAGAYTQMSSIEQDQINYLSEWAKTQNWYQNIPSDALDEFTEGLAEVNDPLKSYEENMAAASKYGSDFNSAINSDSFKNIQNMAKGLKDGSVSVEEYNKAVESFKSSFSGDEAVLNSLVNYFSEISDNAIEASNSTATYTKNLSDMSDTVSQLEKSYEILDKAKKEMENGSLSADTIQSIIDVMKEGENYLDYLEFENGQIKLNTQAWEKRADATILGDLDEIKKETDSLAQQNAVLEERIKNTKEQGEAGKLSGDWGKEVEEYTNQLEANNEKIRENQALLGMYDSIYESIANKMIDVLDFTDLAGDLSGIESSVKGLVSAMDKLGEGTALTKEQFANLALQYPKLLEQSDLFVDGSIGGQKKLLDYVLNEKEAEYDAHIDTKIAELKATEQVINDQLSLETEKQNIIGEIKTLSVNGEVEQHEKLIEKMQELNDLQGRNYVTMEDGILTVSENALNEKLSKENEYAEKSTENIWQPFAGTIKEAHVEGYSKALDATDTFGSKLREKIIKAAKVLANLGKMVADVFTFQFKGFDYYFRDASNDAISEVRKTYNSLGVGDVEVRFDGNKAFIDDTNIDDWISNQEKASIARIEALEDFKVKTVNTYKNLEKLKGLDLTSIYGSAGSLSSKKNEKDKKEIEEYIASIDELYSAVKRLEEVQKRRDNLEAELNHTDDPSAKIKLYDKLTDVYKEEAAAEENLINARKSTIQKNVKALRELGFQVDYNSESNELYIKNLEHLNEITATSKGKYESLQEATNELRKETEELIDVTETLNDDNNQSIDNIENLVYEIQDAAEEIINCIEEVYDKQIDAYNKIIEKRKEALESAKEEYDYEEEIAEKVKEIADLQSKIDKLSLDDSREAQVKKNELIKELNDLQKDLSDTQRDYSYDNQIDSLEKMSEKYEEEKNSELEVLKQSIGTVQDLGTNIDERITNAWKNAKKAVEEYGECVNRLNVGSTATVGVVPKYHTGGIVGGNASEKEEVFALLQAGEIVLNDDEQDSVYKIIDFQTELSKRLGVSLGNANLSFINPNIVHDIGDTTPNIVDNSNKTIFSPEISVEIYHNGDMSDGDAYHYGEEIAETAITKLYNAFERKGISYRSGSKLRP